MGSLVTQAQSAYNTWKSENTPTDVSGWSELTDAEALALWRTEQTYLQAISDAQAIETSFYEARTEAFAAFEATKQSEFAALSSLWQSKEDNDYDVDYTPE